MNEMSEQKIAPVLSDDDIATIRKESDAPYSSMVGYDMRLSRAIEQAVLARVGAVRDQALEEAVCAVRMIEIDGTTMGVDAVRLAVTNIRALKGTPAAAPCPTCNDNGAVGTLDNTVFCPECTPAAAVAGWSDDQMIGFASQVLIQGNKADSIQLRLESFRRHERMRGTPAPQLSGNPGQVADAQPVAHVAGDDVTRYLNWSKDRSAWEMPVGTPVYYAQPSTNPGPLAAVEPSGNAGELVEETAWLLRKYRNLCMEIGRGDSHHLARIDAAIAASKEGASHE